MAVFTELSLFSGAGGGLLGTRYLLGWRTVCYVEWDKYAVEVLKARIRDGYLDDAPIWDDVRTFDGRPWAGLVDVVSAGFPCQPYSVSGRMLAADDPRNGWPSTIRIIREVRPRIAWLENVPGLLSGRHGYFGTILEELDEAGYRVEWDCVSAEEVGAPHKRERVWILAYAKGEGRQCLAVERKQNKKNTDLVGQGEDVSDTNGERLQKPKQERQLQGSITKCDWWTVEPRLGRVVDGVAHRVDRLRAIGNGQVPRVVAEAWGRLK